MAHCFPAFTLSSLSIAAIILNQETTIITIARKKAKTLKKVRICKNKLFCKLFTKSVVHFTLSILRTYHNIHIAQKTKNAQ
jgi:NAD(P)H-nitrite reductase large subunit